MFVKCQDRASAVHSMTSSARATLARLEHLRLSARVEANQLLARVGGSAGSFETPYQLTRLLDCPSAHAHLLFRKWLIGVGRCSAYQSSCGHFGVQCFTADLAFRQSSNLNKANPRRPLI
jgi:hypothetical protein